MNKIGLWTEKYKPNIIDEIISNKTEVENIIKWLDSWSNKIPKKRALLIYGPAGIGKTASIEAIAKYLTVDLIEINASDKRNSDEIKKIVGKASLQKSLFSQKIRIILVDEVDGILGQQDKGGIGELLKIIRTTLNPIIMTANDPWNPSLRNLREASELIQYKRARSQSILKLLIKISQFENIKVEDSVLGIIASNSNGDVRSAINDLQFFSEGKKVLNENDIFYNRPRDRVAQIFDVLKKIFEAKTIEEAKMAYDLSDTDYDLFFKWIIENAYLHCKTEEELCDVYSILSYADINLTRIRKTNNWSLFKYFIFFMTGGVSMSVSDKYGWKKYQFPSWIRKLSSSKKEREMTRELNYKIKNKCHVGLNKIKTEFLPYLKIIFQNNIKRAYQLNMYFKFNEEETNYLTQKKTITKKILKYKE